MLKIERNSNGSVVFRLAGQIEKEDTVELERLFECEPRRQIKLDLKDITLADADAVRFLSGCEAQSIHLENCPAYIREWISRLRAQDCG